ncbi:lipoprotein insertase outer membrane protein LolB [Kistimonas scapharcae]|uniref:Outer-membrane lipoprotein LolB n=1 Tax=Kistimonas scapharcae TaxID=1036133 RepID=A0ABP8VA16_9GAMM
MCRLLGAVRYWAGLLFLLVLAGCAGRAPLSQDVEQRSWQEHVEAMAALDHWQLSGKLGVRTASEAGSATLEWEEQAGSYTVYLTGPFGQSLASIEGAPGHVVMTVPDEGVLMGPSLETLVYQQTGWVIPFRLLQYWVKGVPAPGSYADLQLNDMNRLQSLNQAGWMIVFDRFGVTSGYELPGRLKLQKGDIKVTLLIRRWQLSR